MTYDEALSALVEQRTVYHGPVPVRLTKLWAGEGSQRRWGEWAEVCAMHEDATPHEVLLSELSATAPDAPLGMALIKPEPEANALQVIQARVRAGNERRAGECAAERYAVGTRVLFSGTSGRVTHDDGGAFVRVRDEHGWDWGVFRERLVRVAVP